MKWWRPIVIAIGLIGLAGCVVTKNVPVEVDHYEKQRVPASLLNCGEEPRPAGLSDRQLADQLASVTIWGRGCAENLGQVKGLVEPTTGAP